MRGIGGGEKSRSLASLGMTSLCCEQTIPEQAYSPARCRRYSEQAYFAGELIPLTNLLLCGRDLRRAQRKGSLRGRELGGAQANFAGDRVYFHAATIAATNAGAQGMLALFFNHYGNIRLDFTGDGFGGQMKTCVCRDT